MDPLTAGAVAAVFNNFLGNAAAEAGKSAWAKLVGIVRSAFPDRADVAEAAERLAPGASGGSGAPGAPGAATAPDQAAVIDLSAELAALARSNAGFDGALREWLSQARALSIEGGITSNVIGDGATVRGNVVQGRDIGSISFG
jgi:hypothetical protein